MIILAALVLGIFILLSTGVLVFTIIGLSKIEEARIATMRCLRDLVKRLNKEFPGSNLIVTKTENQVKVTGELKYYTK